MAMAWEGTKRWILFVAGMLCSIEAGHLFYLDRLSAGGAFLLLAGTFLFFSQRERARREEEPPEEAQVESGGGPAAGLALFVAEEALNGLKRIGRTMPPSSMEVTQLEDRLSALLGSMGVPAEERRQLNEELEKLKGRARRNEGRRALSQSTRL